MKLYSTRHGPPSYVHFRFKFLNYLCPHKYGLFIISFKSKISSDSCESILKFMSELESEMKFLGLTIC
jgi:hypothetical protein